MRGKLIDRLVPPLARSTVYAMATASGGENFLKNARAGEPYPLWKADFTTFAGAAATF